MGSWNVGNSPPPSPEQMDPLVPHGGRGADIIVINAQECTYDEGKVAKEQILGNLTGAMTQFTVRLEIPATSDRRRRHVRGRARGPACSAAATQQRLLLRAAQVNKERLPITLDREHYVVISMESEPGVKYTKQVFTSPLFKPGSARYTWPTPVPLVHEAKKGEQDGFHVFQSSRLLHVALYHDKKKLAEGAVDVEGLTADAEESANKQVGVALQACGAGGKPDAVLVSLRLNYEQHVSRARMTTLTSRSSTAMKTFEEEQASESVARRGKLSVCVVKARKLLRSGSSRCGNPDAKCKINLLVRRGAVGDVCVRVRVRVRARAAYLRANRRDGVALCPAG